MLESNTPNNALEIDAPPAMHVPGYEIIRKLNSGGMATVYLATQLSIGRTVALKIMRSELDKDPEFHERFQREATIVGQLSHPNIIPIYDIGRHLGMNYISMEYLPGGSLDQKISAQLTADESIDIVLAMASALDHAHSKGYVHRDIKPENILFRADGTPVLTDFGIARMIKTHNSMTQVGSVIGTPSYMSPEQAKGEALDGRSDLYSLGVLFYEMLTGKRPFRNEQSLALALQHISEKPDNLPLEFFAFQDVVDKLLAKKPEHRFQRGQELIAALETIKHSTHPLVMQGKGDTNKTRLLKAIGYTLFDNASAFLRQRWQKLNEKSVDNISAIAPDITLAATQVIDAPALDSFSNRKAWKIIGGLSLMGLALLLGFEFTHQQSSSAKRQDLFGTDNKKSSLPLMLSLEPGDAHVRLLNIDSSYAPGMELPPGYYQLEISAPGYNTKREWIHLTSLNQALHFQLDTTDTQRDFIEPEMVEIPTGNLAVSETTNGPITKLAIEKNFFVGKYEVTFAEYDAFAKATNHQLPDDEGWGRDDHPVINISWKDAQAYAEWLSDRTGKSYRLPTGAEWEFAARAKSSKTYWWGNTTDKAASFANCQKGCRPWLQTFLRNKTKVVGSYPPNDFGVHDTAGNAAEWVADCAQKNSNGVCEQRLLRGGSFNDSVENISNVAQVPRSADTFNTTTGMRLVRDMPAGKKTEPTTTSQPAQNPVQRFFHRIFK